MTGNYTDIEKKIIDDPQTRGEASVSKRMKSVGNDYKDLVQFRSRLDALKNDLRSADPAPEYRDRTSGKMHDIQAEHRRAYDSSILRKRPFTFFQQLLSYRRILTEFKSKYGISGKVTGGLWNLLLNGSLLAPSQQVYNFAQKIISRQDELRVPFQKLYNAGWLTRAGADMLTPLEFNLIGEMQRLVSDNSIFNFVINHKRPAVAINKTNHFLGYYFSVTRDHETRAVLLNAIKKSLTRNVYTDLKQKKKGEQIFKTVNLLLSDEVEDNFIIPLFECYYTAPLSIDEVKSYVVVEDINEIEYQAQSSLHAYMGEKKSRYNDRLLTEANRIEEEILLVSDLRECINKSSLTPAGFSGDYLDFLLYQKYYADDTEYDLKKGNLALLVADLCTFFVSYYAPILLLEIDVRIGEAMKKIKIFEDAVFENEDREIKIESRNLNNFFKNIFKEDLLEKNVKGLSHKETLFINTLNIINDAFFHIGVKLHVILNGHEKHAKGDTIRSSPINEKDLGNSSIPYFEGDIIQLQASSEFDKHALANKKVLPALIEIKDFCFSFAYKFEFQSRNFHETVRKESLGEKITKLDLLHEKIQKIEAGESVGEDG